MIEIIKICITILLFPLVMILGIFITLWMIHEALWRDNKWQTKA